ncbi:efflux RND transporter periplasmic adaptor subunit [Pelotomaculum isophthalicicum JI]|uniref:Efflux RND transporter periplasmic adaptor subunit n=1 Tax=Pelotomaculum isophthalicicum JI TaxID=947010 RepID=A0A9X4H5R2_9FIRM|nr:efflux RND transporter periplasmic adaptor subunit [Pelotomaculum isophthalicicum]MDF9408657.1 efflux RND transporter periplasmic adaptor subunit [Pelotomaculum isophthalicicum JI]
MQKKRFLYIIITLSFLVAAAYFAMERKKDFTGAPNPRAVETMTVQAQTTRSGGGLAGIVKPFKEAKLGFQVSGRIQGPVLDEGTLVEEGSVLASLDPADYQAQVEAAGAATEAARAGIEQAAAVLGQAEAAYRKAQQDYERVKSLYEAKAVSKAQFDDAGTQLSVAAAKYHEAQSGYNEGQGASVSDYHKAQALASQSRLQLSHTKLTAPFKGTVLKKAGEVGEMVSAGTPVYVIGDLDRIKIEVTVAAAELNNWQASDPVDVTSPDQPGRNWPGEVTLVHPAADSQTGTFLIEVSVDNPGHLLKPGMVARVASRRQTRATVWVPVGALVKRGSEVTVFVIRDDKSFTKKITTGDTIGNQIEITSGLDPGEELVVRGALYLHDGDPVLRQKS